MNGRSSKIIFDIFIRTIAQQLFHIYKIIREHRFMQWRVFHVSSNQKRKKKQLSITLLRQEAKTVKILLTDHFHLKMRQKKEYN